MNNLLATRKTLEVSSLEDVQKLAQVFYRSGLFQDTKSEAQAIVKIYL